MVKKITTFCLVLFSLVFAQKQPSNSQGFILYEVNSIKSDIGNNNIFPEPNPVGENKNIILLDSNTGKTWILTSILQGINIKDKNATPERLVYYWAPIYFDDREDFDSEGTNIHMGMTKKPLQ